MLAFLAPIPCTARPRFLRPATSRTRPRHGPPRATLSPQDDDLRVRFNRDVPDEPMRTFLPSAAPISDRPLSPNDRILTQVRDTMSRLGVSDAEPASPPPVNPVDISRVNPLSAYAGAVAAALLSYTAWNILDLIIHFFYAHPLDDQIYVVQRIAAVVRTALVSLFALGSGISGVTSLGLLLLAGRTTVAAITGEFRHKDDDSQSQQ